MVLISGWPQMLDTEFYDKNIRPGKEDCYECWIMDISISGIIVIIFVVLCMVWSVWYEYHNSV